MNRIYQGRINKGSLLKAGHKGDEPADWENLENPEGQLLEHHRIFQDAVNYYMLALGALADPEHAEGDPFVAGLRARLNEAWEHFPRQDVAKAARSLRDSVAPWLGLDSDATLEDAFKVILLEDHPAETNCLALYALLSDLGGESKIQQGGRGYFPLFCDSATKANFPRAEAKQLKAKGETLVPELLWNQTDPESTEALSALKDSLCLEYFALPSTDGKCFDDAELREKLEWAIVRMCDQGKLAGSVESWQLKLEGLELPKLRRHGAVNKDASKDRFAAWLMFHFVEQTKETFEALKSTFKEPSTGKAKEKTFGSRLEKKLEGLAEDPILVARGARGYVFPAFTALRAWKPESEGLPVWKEFDIAAFKEALKGYNQFNQITDRREEEKAKIAAQIAWMTEAGADAPQSLDEGEVDLRYPSRLVGDSRFELAKDLEKKLGEQLMEGEYHITRASLRGFRDIRERMNKLGKDCTQSELEAVVKAYQRGEQHIADMGSVVLFLTLCEREYWPLWQEEEESLIEQRKADGQAVNMLYAIADLHELEAQLEHKKEAVHLTPAEPKYSRRLFSFSDVMTNTYRKNKLIQAMQKGECEVSLALGAKDGSCEKRTLRLGFKAPRMYRDQLLEDSETRWLQPMMEALEVDQAAACGAYDKVALSLMPDWKRKADQETFRCLLNFSVSLQTEALVKSLREKSLTDTPLGTLDGQLNSSQDANFHLHWKETLPEKYRDQAWYAQQGFLVNGMEFLANDLGQRSAGAWARIRVQCEKPNKKYVLELGKAGGQEWYAYAVDFGLYRLPGENEQDERKDQHEPTLRGRGASREERKQALILAQVYGIQTEEGARKWITDRLKFPEQNDQLIKLAGRRLSRLMTYHRWSCFDPETIADAARRASAIEKMLKEVELYAEHKEWVAFLECRDFEAFRDAVGKAFRDLRKSLEKPLLDLANRVAPLRDRSWVWRKCDDSKYGHLSDIGVAPENKPRVMGQRGISLKRIEQLEGLRTLFLRFNRAQDREPGTAVAFGSADRGRTTGEPCEALLGKIERLKAERINQTAHWILAQALGVRLRLDGKSPTSEDEQVRRDLHGEYERIPGRRPVDAIVLEDLQSYRTTHDRAPGENKKLMNWAHRAVSEKIKLLAEPFGIPVLEVAAAYSSKFDSRSFQPGFRAFDTWDYGTKMIERLEKQQEKLDPDTKRYALLGEFRRQLNLVHTANQNLSGSGSPRLTLLFPKRGGPVFVPAKEGSPMQADINAAINLAFRACASYRTLSVFSRIRTQRKQSKKNQDPIWQPWATKAARANKREIAVFKNKPTVELLNQPSEKLKKSAFANFFYDPRCIGLFDRGKIQISDDQTIPVSSGIAFWSRVRDLELRRCVAINADRIKKWKAKGHITKAVEAQADKALEKDADKNTV